MSETPQVGFQITSDPDLTTVGAPATAGARLRETPGACRFLLVADLDPQAPAVAWDGESRVVSVDANTFADVLRAASPRLDVSVADHLGDAERRDVEWTVDALDALTPAGIVARVPALAAVAEARAAVAEARAGRLDSDALRARLRDTGLSGADALADSVQTRAGAPNPGAPPSGSGRLDGLLGLVSLDGDNTPAASSGPADALARAAVGDGTGIDAAAADGLVANLDERLRAQVVAILDHPDVRRLDAAWHGVKFLVDRLAFRKGARLDVLAASRDDLAEAIHFQVLLPEHAAGASRVPLAALVVDYAFDVTAADTDAMTDLAETGASLQVPVVASIAPTFFGLGKATDFSRLPPAVSHTARAEYAAFRSLRVRPEAAFLSLALPPFVLRPSYSTDFPDRAHGVEGGETLWGGGALLVAAAMASRHAETGWPVPTMGAAVENLTVRKTRMGALPLAAAFGDAVMMDVARAGFLGLTGPLRSDRALLGPPVTIAASAESGLSGAVFSALASHLALKMEAELTGTDEQVRAEIDRRFRSWLGDGLAEDAVTVQILPEHDTETARTLGVRLRPPARILPGGMDVVLGVTVLHSIPAEGAPADGE